MSKWNISFGETDCWDPESKMYVKKSLELSFDSKDSLPLKFETKHGGSWENNASATFKMEFINDHGLVSIGDQIFSLNEEQFSKFLSIEGRWVYEDPQPEPFDLNKWNPVELHRDLGLVFMYDAAKQEFGMAHLQLYFHWESDNPIILYAITFDESKMPEYENKTACQKITLEYIDEIAGLHHYILCEQHCLLTDAQVELIQSIQQKI